MITKNMLNAPILNIATKLYIKLYSGNSDTVAMHTRSFRMGVVTGLLLIAGLLPMIAAAQPTSITLSLDPATVTESSDPTEITVTVTLVGGTFAAGRIIGFSALIGGTATVGTDFTLVPGADLTIPANTASVSTTFMFTALVDMDDEPAGETTVIGGTLFSLGFDRDTSVPITPATLTIHDPVPTGVTLSVDPTEVTESSDATTITVTATLVGGTFTEERRITLSAGTASTATLTTDYTPAITHTITIPANMASSSVDIPFTATVDTETEAGGETVIIQRNLATAGGTNAVDRETPITPATLTINDPTAPTGFTVSVTPTEVTEFATPTDITVTATLDGGTFGVERFFQIFTEDGTATAGTDYTAVTRTVLTIPANMASGIRTFPFTAVDDMEAESGGETVGLTVAFLNAMQTGTDNSLGSVPPTTLTINDRTAPTGLTFSLSPNTVTESSTATTITVTATLTGGTFAEARRTFFGTSTSGNTATAGTDYTVVPNTFLTIPANMASVSMDILFTAIVDATADLGETVIVSGALFEREGGAVSSLPITHAILTINDYIPIAANAGADQRVATGGTIMLTGVVTSAAEATVATTWALTSSAATTTALEAAGVSSGDAATEVTRLTAALASITTPAGTFPAPAFGLTSAVALAFTLTATDAPAGVMGTATDEVIITVDTPPAFTNMAMFSTAIEAAENQTAVGTAGFFAAPGSGTVNLMLGGTDVARFAITSNGTLTFNDAPDFEMPRGMALSGTNTNDYALTVTAMNTALARRRAGP